MATLFEVHNTSNKGRSILATQYIPTGTQIIHEPALFTTETFEITNTQLSKKLKMLSRDNQRHFFELFNNFPDKGRSGIFATNAFRIIAGENKSAIFLQSSLINHACNPNAQQSINPDSNYMSIYAIKDIPAGTEVTISYMDLLQYHDRQQTLTKNYGFACACELCMKSDVARKVDDGHIQFIHDAFRLRSTMDYKLEHGLSVVRKAIIACKTLGFVNGELFCAMHTHASRIMHAYSEKYDSLDNIARECVFIQRIRDLLLIYREPTHPELVKAENYIQYPQVISGLKRAPKDLTEFQFDKWLWLNTDLSNCI